MAIPNCRVSGKSLPVHLGEEKMVLVNSQAISATLNLDKHPLITNILEFFPIFTFVLSQFFFSTYQLNHPLKRNSDHLPPLLNIIQWFHLPCVFQRPYDLKTLYDLPLTLFHDSCLSLLPTCSLHHSYTGHQSLLQICQAYRISSLFCPEHSSSQILSELTLILPSDLCSNLLSRLC